MSTIPAVERSRRRRPRRSHRTLADRLQQAGGIWLCLLVVATPWLFGTTEPWSERLMNAGSILAALLILPAGFKAIAGPDDSIPERSFRVAFISLNLLLILFCAVAVLNARASFDYNARAFTYFERTLPWLPTTYDRARSLQFLINISAFFLIFWSAHAWIAGGWRGAIHDSERNEISAPANRRLKLLLWVLAVNGFALALQGIFQRLTGSNKLLWIRPSWWATSYSCFGPFSYRGNAADYLNLIWPVTFGFWYYLLKRRHRPGRVLSDGPELLLLPMFLVTAAATFISLSRGAALVAALMLALVFGMVLLQARSRALKISVIAGALAVFALVLAISQGQLLERFKTASSDPLSGREEIYANARQIAADFPVFGAGPGTFPSIYHMYRQSAGQVWQAFLHDDWLETRVTFGWVGFILVLLQFACLFAWAWASRDAWLSRFFGYCVIISLLGCLLHAKVDFPFQTYSLEFTFVILAAILVTCRFRKAPPASSHLPETSESSP